MSFNGLQKETDMYMRLRKVPEYGFQGTFYMSEWKGGDDGDQLSGTETEVIVLETKCDIQETKRSFQSGTITQGFTVYFPWNGSEIPVRDGMRFRCNDFHVPVDMLVSGVFPTHFGCLTYIEGSGI